MRLALTCMLAVAFVAACAGDPPSQTPILPWSPSEVTSEPSAAATDASAAPSDEAADPVWSWTCQPELPTDDPANWVAVSPEGQGFSIRLPGPALATSTDVATPAGAVTMLAWAFLDGCGRTFGVTHMRFEAGALSEAGPPSTVLDQVVSIQLQSGGGAVTAQSDVTVGGSPGRRFSIAGDGFVVEALVVVAGDDLYQVVMSARTTYRWPATSLDAFFASFSIGG